MEAGSVQALVEAVSGCGAELRLSAEGRLVVCRWERLPAALQQQVDRRGFEIVALLCRDARYRLTAGRLTELRRWAAAGELDTVRDALWAQPGVEIPAGEAGVRAAFWLRCYDTGEGREHAERLLRGLYYGALLYRRTLTGRASS